MKYLNLLLIASLFSSTSFCQEAKLSEAITRTAEELAADDSDPEAAALYIEKLHELAENPVRLNSSGEDEISRLFFLTDFQVKALVDYVHSSGMILSVYEIVNIPGFDKETVTMMIPFVKIDNKRRTITDTLKWRSTLITNLSYKPATDDSSSLGSPMKFLSRYRFSAGNFSGGFTVEKDPGEKLFTGNPPLPDFFSAGIAYSGTGVIRRIIIGDFSARFGQGTNINTGIRTALSLTAPGYMSARNEIRQYTSTDENKFFRGVATELAVKNLGISFFYSRKNSDATPGSSSGTHYDYIDNFYISGLHNTTSLLIKKDAISDLTLGINLSYNFTNIRVGAVWTSDRLSLPVSPDTGDPQKVFSFKGDKSNLCSIYYNCLINKILLYGELTSNEQFRYAFVQGITLRASDRLAVNFLLRNYEPGYFSLHGNGPGTVSSSGNEREILGNFTFEAARHLFVSGGCDIQNFSWLKYRCSSPSTGIKKEIIVRFLPSEKLIFEGSYVYRLVITDNPATKRIPEQKQTISKTIRGSVKYSPVGNLTFGTRLEYKKIYDSGSRGILLFQDVIYRFGKTPVTAWFRYCIFSTDDWDSRLYAYENDLLYNYSIPALSGEGSRSYIMLKWDIDIAEIRFKYSVTSLAQSSTSRLNKDEIKLQVKMVF
jgi:hypothetical protein